MPVQEKTRKTFSFGKGLFLLFSLLLVGITIAMLLLWSYLTAYQKNLPQTKADRVVAQYAAGDAAGLTALAGLPASDAVLFDDLFSTLEPEKLFAYQSEKKGDCLTYILVHDTQKIATLTLAADGERDRYGFLPHKIVSLQPERYEYTLFAPSDSQPTVAGFPLAEGKPMFSTKFLKRLGQEEISILSYPVSLLAPPKAAIAGKAKDGKPLTASIDTARKEIYLGTSFAAGEEETLRSTATDFTKTYMTYVTKRRVPARETLAFLHHASPIRHRLAAYSNYWGEEFDRAVFDRLDCEQLQKHSDSLYSVVVHGVYHVYYDVQKLEKHFPFDQRLYWYRDENGLSLYEMQRLEEK